MKSERQRVDEADEELFRGIRKDEGGAEFDAAEISLAIARLEYAEIEDSCNVGNGYSVKLRVPGGEVEHVLRIPTLKEIRAEGLATVQNTPRRNGLETRVVLEPTGALWDKLLVLVAGYDGPVPIVHKVAAFEEVQRLLRAELEEGDPPEASSLADGPSGQASGT